MGKGKGSFDSRFLRLDTRQTQFSDGYRKAVRACVAWLEDESMNVNPKAGRSMRRAASEMSREARAVMAGEDEAAYRDSVVAEVVPNDAMRAKMMAALGFKEPENASPNLDYVSVRAKLLKGIGGG